MIFITLGTSPYPFNRAVRWIEDLCEVGRLAEPVLFQYGSSESALCLKRFDNISVFESVSADEFAKAAKGSRLTISHAGQGSTFTLAKQEVPFAILPRLARYGEHVDDHQLGFARNVEKFGVRVCLEPSQLAEVVTSPPQLVPTSLIAGPRLVDHLVQTFS